MVAATMVMGIAVMVIIRWDGKVDIYSVTLAYLKAIGNTGGSHLSRPQEQFLRLYATAASNFIINLNLLLVDPADI